MAVLPFLAASNVTFFNLFAEIYPRGAPIFHSVYIAIAAVPRKGVVYSEDGEDDDTADIHALFVKRARGCKEGIVTSKQPTVPAQDDLARAPVRVLLRRVYFLYEGRTRYVSVGVYPSDNYQVLVELGGPRIEPIRLAEQHVR